MEPISYYYSGSTTTTTTTEEYEDYNNNKNNKLILNLNNNNNNLSSPKITSSTPPTTPSKLQQPQQSYKSIFQFNLINRLNYINKQIKKIPNEIKKIYKENLLLCIWMFINLVSLLMNQSLEENFNFLSYNTLIGSQLIISFFISYFYSKFKKKYQIKEIIDIVSIPKNEDYEINSEDNIIIKVNDEQVEESSSSNNNKNCTKITIKEMIKIIIPLSFIFVINCIFNSKLSENIVEFSKTVVPLTVVGLQFILTKRRYGKTLYYSIIILVIGTAIFLLYEPLVFYDNNNNRSIELIPNFKQFILALIVISFMSLTLIYSHSIFSTRLSTIDPILIIQYFSPISLIMLIPFIFSESNLNSTFISQFKNYNELYNFLICLIISGIFAYFTLMSISRNSKSILLKLFSSGVFHEPISSGNWFGFIISSAGILISYQNSSNNENDDTTNNTNESINNHDDNN